MRSGVVIPSLLEGGSRDLGLYTRITKMVLHCNCSTASYEYNLINHITSSYSSFLYSPRWAGQIVTNGGVLKYAPSDIQLAIILITFRPNHFIQVKVIDGSVIENLFIKNWPAHGFTVASSSDLTIRNIVMDKSDGDAPNA